MTDFKGFNPDRSLGSNFQTNRKGNGKPPETSSPTEKEQAPVDPYADLKMPPARMMDLLSAQGSSNQALLASNGVVNHIEMAINAFSNSVSPERHSLASRLLEQTYQNEFGGKPGAGILQDILDDYLIGQPVIQVSQA
jgi:hypothetical protein